MLAQELHTPEIQKREVYAILKDNIWTANLAEMGLLSSFDCGIKYLL